MSTFCRYENQLLPFRELLESDVFAEDRSKKLPERSDSNFEGTIFRLPIRSAEQSQASLITQSTIDTEEMVDLLVQFQVRFGAALPVVTTMLRSVLHTVIEM